jgi:DNA-binding transcriptional regulator YiaG
VDKIQLRARKELKHIRRHDLGMSVMEFAELLNVSWHTVKAWESGQRNIIAPTMLSLWWNGNLEASRIAGRIFQKAFEGMFLNDQ